MKTKPYTILSLSLAALALSAQPLLSKDKDKNKDYDTSASANWQSKSNDVTRVSKDHLEQISTAKDLIGSSIYDEAGEKIGDVKDVSLGHRIKADYSTAQLSDRSSIGENRDLEGNRQSNTQTNRNDSQLNRDGNQLGSEDIQSYRSDTAMSGNSHSPYVFISVGGVMGFGDDVVRVPLSSLRRDAVEKDHLILEGQNKAAVVAIAEQKPLEFRVADYESDKEYDETSRAKRVFGDNNDDTAKISEALRSNDQLGALAASKIEVEKEGETIVLSGTVSSRTQKTEAEKIAKEHTSMQVKNKIEVKTN